MGPTLGALMTLHGPLERKLELVWLPELMLKSSATSLILKLERITLYPTLVVVGVLKGLWMPLPAQSALRTDVIALPPSPSSWPPSSLYSSVLCKHTRYKH